MNGETEKRGRPVMVDQPLIIGAPAGARGPQKIKLYNFKRPDKFSKDQIRTVAIMHETFARLVTTSLAAVLRTEFTAHVAAVDQLTYGEFIQSMPSPTAMGIVMMTPLRGAAVLQIDPPLVFSFLDRLYGGPGVSQDLERELTPIEITGAERIVARLAASLGEAWTKVIDLKATLGQIETSPQYAQIVPPPEMIILVTLAARMGDVEGRINLCIPYLTIEPLIPKLSARYWYSTVGRDTRAAAAIEPSELRVASSLYYQGEEMTLTDLAALKRGSLVRLPGLEKRQATLEVGGQPVLTLETCPPHRHRIVRAADDAQPVELKPEPLAPQETLAQALRKPIEELGAVVMAALKPLEERLEEIVRRQDELSDQLLLGGGEVAPAEPVRRQNRAFSFVQMSDVDNLIRLIGGEHPQTVALILAYLGPDVAAAALERLAEEVQAEVTGRLARLDRTNPDVVADVERVVRERLLAMGTWEMFHRAGGVDAVTEVLNLTSRAVEKNVVETLERADPELAEQVKKRMFVFEDVILLDDPTMRGVLSRASQQDVALALKTVPENVGNHVLANAPDRAAVEKIRDSLGRRRLSEVEAAQTRIVTLIRVMEEEGEIVVARPDQTVD